MRLEERGRFDRRHRVHVLSKLAPGQEVWVTDSKVTGTVVGAHATPRSYMVDVPHGTVRRNRHHLIPMDGSEDSGTPLENSPVQAAVPTPMSPPEAPEPLASLQPSVPKTRSGRPIVKPKTLNL